MPMINEAFHAWADGVAEPENIDSIMTLGCALPRGCGCDHIGLDVCRDIMLVMHRGLGDDKYLRPKLVNWSIWAVLATRRVMASTITHSSFVFRADDFMTLK